MWSQGFQAFPRSFQGIYEINTIFIIGQLGGAVDRAPVKESGGAEFKSHLRHLTFTSCVILGKSLNTNCLILGHLQSF